MPAMGIGEDRPGPEGLQAAQILVMDGPGMPWRVDHAFFEERLAKWPPARDLAIGALAEADLGDEQLASRYEPLELPAWHLLVEQDRPAEVL